MCESVLCQAWIDGVAPSPSKTGAGMLDAASKHARGRGLSRALPAVRFSLIKRTAPPAT